MASEIEAFWHGAMLHGTGDEARTVVASGIPLDRVGVRELIAAGVPPERARAWAATGPGTTRGIPIPVTDPRYPARLADAPDPPPVLLVEGDPACLAITPAVAVVGTRACTAYGRSVARTLGHALASAGAVVVSGLARGVDAYAHQGAADAGRTIAVLAHGLAHTAPASNVPLRRTIVERGGVVVTTWPDAFEPARWTFPRRNRWIAAMSAHVVVVEAPVRSGALITAEDALELHRPEDPANVWAVPGPIGAAASAGCLALLEKSQTRVVTSVEALVRAVTGVRPPRDAGWLERLCAGAGLDEVARMREMSTLELMRDLTRLELQGVLVRLPGQRYARSGGVPAG